MNDITSLMSGFGRCQPEIGESVDEMFWSKMTILFKM